MSVISMSPRSGRIHLTAAQNNLSWFAQLHWPAGQPGKLSIVKIATPPLPTSLYG